MVLELEKRQVIKSRLAYPQKSEVDTCEPKFTAPLAADGATGKAVAHKYVPKHE